MSVLGWELNEAVKTLEANGYSVAVFEVRSKKGVDGADSERVIRQSSTDKTSVELCFARVKSKPDADCGNQN